MQPKAIAIVGIGCRFPGGASSPDSFWALLRDGVDAVREAPRDRLDLHALFDDDAASPGKIYARWGGFLDGIDQFDADFFGIAPREARRIDPQHRLLLEVVWEALEDGGIVPDTLANSATGVFVGISTHDYSDLQTGPGNRDGIDAHVNMGGAACIAANRISYALDLRGPSLAIDTACSSSLTAVHLACQSLASGESELAIVGGVNAMLSPDPTIGFCKASMLSPDGRCRPFDAAANGYVRSEGAGVVVLKPLARALDDRDLIYAVIRGTTVNQDGRTPGMSVPSAAAQERMIRDALREAGLPPSAVQYVEAHGTGTRVGDPIEAEALGRVLADGRPAGKSCIVGSVKSNIGHLEAAAGIAGLIKTALALKHRLIPPSLHFRAPNPAIPFDDLRLRVPTALEPWPSAEVAIAGVNSFGFGGTNAHAILEEPPRHEPDPSADAADATRVLAISARSEPALNHLAECYRRQLREEPNASLADLCFTATVCRSHHEHRLAAVADTPGEMAALLDAHLDKEARAGLASGRCQKQREPKLAFVFPGMGPQWWGMGRRLLDSEPVFGETLTECDHLLRPISGWSLLAELTASEAESRVTEPFLAHVANFAIQTALAALWRSWGIVPDAVVGHSSGEMAAACVAGALSLGDGLSLAFHRGRLLQRAAGTGTMLAAGISLAVAARFVADRADLVSVAAVNSPSTLTLSGETAALERIAAELAEQGRFCRFLPVTVPYHGPQMETIREEALAAFSGLQPAAPTVPIVSEVTGQWAEAGAFDAAYWWRNVREPVRFADAIDRLIDDGCEIFVEVGPHPVLAASIAECLAHCGRDGVALPTLRRGEDDGRVTRGTLAALHVRGRRVDWAALNPNGRRIPLPSYPWQRERFWFEPPPTISDARAQPAGTDARHPLLGRRLTSPRAEWQVDLSAPRLAYLQHHVVHGMVVCPGASYAEMALAGAAELAGGAPVAVERIELRKLLFIPEGQPFSLRLLHDPKTASLEIYSQPKASGGEWTLHARARIAASAAVKPADADSSSVDGRCQVDLPASDFYASLDRNGYAFGPIFRGITELRIGDGEAVAWVELPNEAAADANDYLLHPALLDASFQLLFAAVGWPSASDGRFPGTFIPVSIARLSVHRRPGAKCRVHVVVRSREGGEAIGDAWLYDETGAIAAAYEGLCLRALDEGIAGQAAEHDGSAYRVVWEDQPLTASDATAERPPLSPSQLVERGQDQIERLKREWARSPYYETIEPALNAFAARSIVKSLCALGWEPAAENRPPVDRLAETLGIAPAHRRLFARLIRMLDEQPTAREGDESEAGRFRELAASQPSFHAEFGLVSRCASHLAEVLTGATDAREVLLTPDALELLTALYHDSPISRFYNGVSAELVAAAVRDAPPERRVRVLEIGAGTGGTSAAVFARVPDERVDYLFTDLSPYFLSRAKERFRRRSSVRYGVLDAELDPAGQPGLEGGFDLILAANTVHATANVQATLGNLRRLLAPGGTLIVQELTRRSLWLDLTFGLLDGWWRFADADLRPDHALLLADRWQTVLAEAGFVDCRVVSDAERAGDAQQSVLLASSPLVQPSASLGPSELRTRSRWLIFADQGGVAEKLAASLTADGAACKLVVPGKGYRARADGHYEISPESAADIERLLRETSAGGLDARGLIHCWSLDGPAADGLLTTSLMEMQRLVCGSVVRIAQAAAVAGLSEPITSIWLVTAGAQPTGEPSDHVSGVAQAALWGLGRVLANEHPDLGCRLVDLSANRADDEIVALARELGAESSEREFAFRGNRRLVRRLRRRPAPEASDPAEIETVSPDSASFRVEIATPGALESLVLRECLHQEPGSGEVAIRVVAAALTFRDVLVALDMLPSPDDGARRGAYAFGIECAGIVEALGEGVDGLAPGTEVIGLAFGALGSRVNVPATLVAPKPAGLTLEEAASLPSAFLTASYALDHLTRLAAGERVLIHAATGGVGLAAIQIARRAGAEIFATAGSPEKRDLLAALGVDHVLDSRNLAWVDDVLARTDGQGIDVVLNSLAGEAIHAGISLLRPFGRFVEIGKRDILQDSSLGLFAFRKNLSFFALDLVQLGLERPSIVGAMLRDLVRQFDAGTLRPLPHTAFDFAEAERAFRLMAQAKHIGKVVLTLREPGYGVVRRALRPLCRADATYLVTGGLGGFGLHAAGWLVEQGARNIVLMSRSGVPREGAETLAEMRDAGVNVVVLRGDVANPDDVAHVLESIRTTMPSLRGIVHAAMVLDDELVARLDDARLLAVLAPKVAGAWNLHRLTATDELDFFVLFSSVAATLGNPGQANYAAANAFLDSFAAYRRGLGLPAVTINWGVIQGVGYVARHKHLREFTDRMGLAGMAPAEALRMLEHALRGEPADLVVARIDWGRWAARESSIAVSPVIADLVAEQTPLTKATHDGAHGSLLAGLRRASANERRTLLERHIAERVARVLGAAVDRIDLDRPLSEMGFDSLMAVELQTTLKADPGAQLSVVQLLQGISVRDLADGILAQLAVDAPLSEHASETAVDERPDTAAGDLSSEQRRFWFLDRLQPGNPACNLYAAMRLTGQLDVSALERAVGEVVRRHEPLRARFVEIEGEPKQIVAPAASFALPRVDLRSVPMDERETEMHRLATANVQTPFDLSQGPLFRTTLFRLGDDEYVFLLVVHHIAFDAWSGAIFVREVASLYQAFVAGRPSPLLALSTSYADLVDMQRARMQNNQFEEQVEHWRQLLTPIPPELRLPADRRRPGELTHRGGHCAFVVPPRATDEIAAVSRAAGATPFMALLAVQAVLLHRYSGETDICVGTPVLTRHAPGSDAVIGCLINTLAMRVDLGGAPTFREVLERVRATALDAYAHHDVPFERVVEAVRPHRDPGATPFFQTMLVFHNAPAPEAALPGVVLQPISIESGSAMLDLMFMIEAGQSFRGTLEYNADLFDEATAERIAEHFVSLLEAAVEDPDRPISSLPFLPEAEQRRLLVEWNDTAEDLPGPRLLHQLFEQQAARFSNRDAVIFGQARLTYAELGARADRVARRLRRHGVGPDDLVALHADRSPEFVAGVLGVLKAGAACLPLDPAYPPARLAFMLADARPKLMLVQRRLAGSLHREGLVTVILEEVLERSGLDERGQPSSGVDPNNLAYVLYTSGATGDPKGVMLTHGALRNHLAWRQRALPLGADDVVLQRTPLSFDPSIWEIFGPLSAGASLVLADSEAAADPRRLTGVIIDHGVTVIQAVPSLLDVLVDEPAFSACASLRRVVSGGEALTAELRDRFFARSNAELINVYGPTETAIEATSWICRRDGSPVIPIGRPIANVTLHILDEHRQPVPIGVGGELHIGGAGLARGYLNRPDQTAERFIPDPFDSAAGARLFRTGDLARYRSDGAVEFLGRSDRQAKLRGARVEPAEIEAALMRCRSVRQAAVVAVDGPIGTRELAAYVVGDAGSPVDLNDLRRCCAEILPPFMIPARIVPLASLPRLPNGKVDHRSLATSAAAAEISGGRVPPRDDIESRLAEIWSRFFDMRPIGVTDDFFDLGGHSLLAARLAAELRRTFETDVPLAEIFRRPTIEAMARLLRQPDGRAPASLIVPLQADGAKAPLFLVHPVGGSLFSYMELAHQLGRDQPVFGFQTSGLDADNAEPLGIEAMASRYVDALRAVRPEGRCLLGGWSFGAVVAHEMARQLEADGQRVALVALIDPPDLAHAPNVREMDTAEDALARDILSHLGVADADIDSAVEAFRRLDLEGQLARLGEIAARTERTRGLDPVLLRRVIRVFNANRDAMRGHRPGRVVGPVVVFRPSEQRQPNGVVDSSAIEIVPGNHFSMLEAPHVEMLAERLRSRLEAAG